MVVTNSAHSSATIRTHITFSWFDHVVFIAMLALSGLIGIFFGCFGTKQRTSDEYLLGGKSMHVFPVSMSLIAGTFSGVAILAVPADIYKYGAAYIWSTIPIVITSLAATYVYMPVFLKLELVSTYQYLYIRFDNTIKLLASFLYALQLILFNPIVIYLPCLAFSQATGFDVDLIAPATSAFCVFYTAIGGLKAVVWTDTLQNISMVLGSISVLTMGLYQTGITNVLNIAVQGERLNIMNFDLDPTERDSFWAFAIGCTTLWLVDVSINQSTLHRLRAVSTKSQAKLVMLIFCVVSVVLKVLITLTGLAIYARYADCDPIQTGQVLYMDQILPYYVMDVGRSVFGLAGLFIAGVFAAALSTLSTNLINLSATIYTDFLAPFTPIVTSERKVSYILKLIVGIVGIIGTGMVFIVGKFDGLLQFTMSLQGITYGTLLGLFTLGMVFPCANKYGALVGGVAGIIFSSFMVFGNLWYKYQGLLPDHHRPFSTDGCANNVSTSKIHKNAVEDIPSGFFRVSFWYYTFFGCVVVLTVGLLVSWITCRYSPKVRPELISPMFQFLLPKEHIALSAEYKSVSEAVNLKVISQLNEPEKTY